MTLRQALFAVHTVVVFWLHRKYLHLSDFFIKKKCSDAVIVFVYTYPQKFSILHSVTYLMVCIPLAWVAPSHRLLLWDSLERSSADGPLAAASVPALEQSVVLTQNGLQQTPKVEIKAPLTF